MVGVYVIKVGHWETTLHDGINIYFWLVEKCSDMFILLHLMVAVFLPTMNGLTIPLNHDKVSVQKQNNIILHLLLIQLHTNRLS